MPATLQDAITWLVGVIQADAQVIALGSTQAFMYSAPEVGIASYPFVIIGKQAGSHTITMCGTAYDVHYLAIKCVDEGFDGGETARKVIARIRTLVEYQKPVLASGTVLDIQPSSSYEYDEQESGNTNFFHAVQVMKVIL